MRQGFSPNDISVVTRSSEQAASDRLRLSAMDAADTGRVAASGPIATALAQRQAGLVATLRNAGVSPALAEHYATAVREGETLESVLVEDQDADRVAEIMKRYAARAGNGGQQLPESQRQPGTVERAKEAVAEKLGRVENKIEEKREEKREEKQEQRTRGGTVERETEDRYIPVMREELQVGKREIERGAVHVDVRVVERPVNEHITLREEHVYIERRPADRVPRPEEAQFRGGQLDMIERGEEAVVSKQVRVVEEIRLQKRVTEREEVISDKLRSTDVNIDELAGERRSYRAHFDPLGGRRHFDDDLPAYELGRDLRGSESERWEDIETNARQRWEAKRPGTWEKYKEEIRYAWSRSRQR